jgi:hypothetical protein
LKAVDSDSADKSQGFLKAIGTFAAGAVGLYATIKGNALAASATLPLGFGGMYYLNTSDTMQAGVQGATSSILGEALLAVDQVAIGDAEWALARAPLEQALLNEDTDLLLQARSMAPHAHSLLSNELAKRFHATLTELGKILGEPDRLASFHAGPWDKQWLARLLAEIARLHTDVLAKNDPPLTRRFRGLALKLAGLYHLLSRIGPAQEVWQKALVELRNREFAAERRKDLEAGATRPSKEYRHAEANLYVALDMQDEWRQLRALEDYLEQVYGEFGLPAPKGKRLAEVVTARKQRDDIEAAMATALASILSPPPATPAPDCNAPTTYTWTGAGSDIEYPRWVRYTGPPVYKRDQWLTEYMCANAACSGGPLKNGDLVVLLERSAPTQEVLPAPYLAPFSKELPCR